jgi:prepilin-type N-terminal cleavage/methylation domain-containing protein
MTDTEPAVAPEATSCVSRRGRDRGVTLIEIVVTVAMLAIVSVPLGNSVVASIRASSRTVETAKGLTIAQNAADRVNRAPKSCDYAEYARAAAMTEGWASATVSVEQRYFAPSGTVGAGQWMNGATPACIGTEPTPMLVQMVRITVTGGHHGVSSTIEVVKSDV